MSIQTLSVDAAVAIRPLAAAAATGLLAKGAQYALAAVAGLKNTQLPNTLDWASRRPSGWRAAW